MRSRRALLPIILFFGMSVSWGASAPASPANTNNTESVSCLMAARSGCGILIRRGVDERGYILVVETGERGNDSVELKLRGRSIMIRRSEFSRTERSGDAGRFAVVSRSSRFARRIQLPPDADTRRVSRSERDGVITIVVPRLQMPGPVPGAYGYYPYR